MLTIFQRKLGRTSRGAGYIFTPRIFFNLNAEEDILDSGIKRWDQSEHLYRLVWVRGIVWAFGKSGCNLRLHPVWCGASCMRRRRGGRASGPSSSHRSRGISGASPDLAPRGIFLFGIVERRELKHLTRLLMTLGSCSSTPRNQSPSSVTEARFKGR